MLIANNVIVLWFSRYIAIWLEPIARVYEEQIALSLTPILCKDIIKVYSACEITQRDPHDLNNCVKQWGYHISVFSHELSMPCCKQVIPFPLATGYPEHTFEGEMAWSYTCHIWKQLSEMERGHKWEYLSEMYGPLGHIYIEKELICNSCIKQGHRGYHWDQYESIAHGICGWLWMDECQ